MTMHAMNIDQAALPQRPRLLTVEDAKAMPVETMRELFSAHLNPGQLHFMKLLGFDKVKVESAEGVHYVTADGRRILDFFGGFGSVAFGHNHPRIVAARRRFQEEKRHEICMAFMSQYAAALARNLSVIAPGDLDMVFLGSSGSEAMEAAIKVAEQAQGPGRSRVLHAANAFHGKTKGVLDHRLHALPVAVQAGGQPREGSLRRPRRHPSGAGIRPLDRHRRAGDDPGRRRIIEAPTAFWRGLRALCDRHGVLWVADEVQCGVGRTETFFAFERHGVVPDVTAIAKSLGGSKSAMAAMIARATST